MRIAGRSTPLLLVLLIAWAVSLGDAHAQKKDLDYEEFEAVCPYTNGDEELERKLGYVRVGRIPWRGADDSQLVQQNIGGIPMVFVETEHFRIGSSLTTYKIPNDKEERERLRDELGRLRTKLGRLKEPRRELDPWLRVHLYAQRAEDLYRQFHEDWKIEAADYSRRGPHLGFKQKFLLLLCERKSEFGRYLRTYESSDIQYAYRTGWFGEGMLTCVNMEAIAEHWKEERDMPLDSMLACMLSANLAGNFVDGWNFNMFRAPAWLTYGYAHIAQRRFDPRWPVFDGRTTIYGKETDKTDWIPRVGNLVRNDFFASTQEMFGWTKYEDLNQRDHMIAWSRLSYLMSEVEGDPKAFLTASCPSASGLLPADAEVARTRQAAALKEHFGLTPAQLDEAWAQWVKRAYRRR
jgi:hypothetical protein